MKLREAIHALKRMRDARIEDELLYLWLSELDGRVQIEIMLSDVMDVVRYTPEQYDAVLMILPPHDAMYLDWLIFKTAEYYKEYESAQYHGAEFEKKYRKYAAWYMHQYRPAARKRREQERWDTTVWTGSDGTISRG
ncbi:MAG: hypothetical protein IJ381_08460 [Clostridia bacterium]|nr:hypothetical protein [Clostridia bacterium]MBQ7982623.1 hypothetical protein [Clostridia bacterium]